jgi:hypothetical protein
MSERESKARREEARRAGAASRDRKLAAARSRARAAVAAETGKRMAARHVLELGDRAVEVVQAEPGTWHLVTDGGPGPVLAPDDISGMLKADREIKAARQGKAAITARQAAAPDPGDPAAAILAELSGPLGLSAAELEQAVPDRAPGTCVSCRTPLAPRDTAEKCAWCLALHEQPGSREEALARPGSGPVFAVRQRDALGRVRVITYWSCLCGCPDERAHQVRIGVRPLRRPVLTPAVLLAFAALCCWGASSDSPPFLFPAAILFLAFLTSLGGRR